MSSVNAMDNDDKATDVEGGAGLRRALNKPQMERNGLPGFPLAIAAFWHHDIMPNVIARAAG